MDKDTTNGLRWYFLEAFQLNKVSNVKEFAALTGIPKSCMQRYLNGTLPRNEGVLRSIERALGKPAYDVCRARTKLDWDKLMPTLYSNKPTLRNSHHYEVTEEEPMFAREDGATEYSPTAMERLQKKCNELTLENKRLRKENEMLQLALSSLEFGTEHER